MRQTDRRAEPKNLDAVKKDHFIENTEKTSRQKNLNKNDGKTLKIAISVIVIALLLVLFLVVKQNTNLFGSKQAAEMQSVEEENLGSDNNQQSNNQNDIQKSPANSGISTYATTASGDYKIYGEQPFTEEYSIGAFVPELTITGIKFGSGFAHYGIDSDHSDTSVEHKIAVGNNKTKDPNIYRDTYGAFKMGTEVYDVRMYTWLIEGDDYVVLNRVGMGAYDSGQSAGDTFDDGYMTQDADDTVMGVEIHFYKGGTLATSKPEEVSVKGIISFLDLDNDEGVLFNSGIKDIYLTKDTTIQKNTSQLKAYDTSTIGGWIGTIQNNNDDRMSLHAEFTSSYNSPLTFQYFCRTGWHSVIQSSVANITYHIDGYAPEGANYPEKTLYIANYGTYTVIDSLNVSGYKFTGWNRDSINGTNVSGKTIAPITEDIDLYGKFTMNVPVTKKWNDNNNQGKVRPESITVTLYDGDTSTGKTLTLNNANNWTGKFENVDASANYTLRENTPAGYAYEVTGNALDGFTITNNAKYSSVIVHHYIEGTETPVPSVDGGTVQDAIIEGQVGSEYSTSKSDKISPNYEFVKSQGTTSGKIQEGTTEVIYYYKIKQAGIEQKITKQGTPGTITEEDQKVTYNITYTANITDYIGNASVTIVDTLPFSIDTSTGKSNLNGGRYDAGQNAALD